MARLELEAVVTAGAADSSSAGAAFAALSITSVDGAPQNDLDDSNLRVFVIASPSGTPDPITFVLNQPRNDGCYLLSLFPGNGTPEERWQKGVYLLGFAARSLGNVGQTLADVNIP